MKPETLITGATGLVGSHLLANLCLQGKSVRAIYRNPSKIEAVKQVFSYYTNDVEKLFNQIEWVETDINDVPALTRAFEGIKYVYHCAAVVSFQKRDYDIMRKVNIEGTANMVNLALAHGVQKFCHVSSIATMDKDENNDVVTEQNSWNPEINNSEYAITKYGAEMEVWRATQEGLKIVMVNPGVILGSGHWDKNTGLLFKKVSDGFRFYTEGITGFVGVWDVVKAMVQLMENDIANERFILVSENRSYGDVLTTIAQQMNKPAPTIRAGRFLLQTAWFLDLIRSLFTSKSEFSKDFITSAVNKTFYNPAKIQKSLDFTFEPLVETIGKCVKDFKATK